MNVMRSEVLRSFKSLHKARKKIFKDDELALKESRKRINEEYATHKHVQDVDVVRQLVQHAKDVEKLLLTTVIQAKLVAPNKYEVRINEETVKLDNVPYQDCCQNKEKNK